MRCNLSTLLVRGLRDYGTEPQIWGDWRGSYGLEPTIELYVQHTVEIFREVRRVLRMDGIFFLNLGDSYSGSGGAGGDYNPSGLKEGQPKYPGRKGLKPKDLCMIPARVALALQADGWWLRSDVIWAKPNPMPESCTDRPTRSHEYIFLLTKSANYFWDQEAVREPHTNSHHNGIRKEYDCKPTLAASKSKGVQVGNHPGGRNIRSVWTIATAPYPEAHFATFPPKLVETCLKAGTSEKGCCPKCGAPWVRVVEKTGHINKREPAHCPNNCPTKVDSSGWAPTTRATNLWKPSCKCYLPSAGAILIPPDPIPCTVLDPFAGAGTTCLVAAKMGRDSIGIELKPEYVAMAKKRIKADMGMLVEVRDEM